MNSVAKTGKKSRSRNNRFNKLWRRAEKLERDNARLRERLDSLVERVQREMAPAEMERAEAARDLILHLLPFLQRKSLTQWQREEIRDWIEQELSVVMAAGLRDEALMDALARDWALQRGMEIDEESDLSVAEQVEAMARGEREAEDETLDDIIGQACEAFEAMVQQEVEEQVRERFGSTRRRNQGAAADDLFAAELDAAERQREEEIERFRREAERDVRQRVEAQFGAAPDDAWADAARGFGDGDETPGGGADAPAAVDRGVFERLFRRAANMLHPDKEQDEIRRAEKQALMGTLLKAREDQDVLTVFRLHREHSGGAPDLDARDEKELLDVLEHQVERLEVEQDEIIQQSPVHEAVYNDFYGQPKKKVERDLDEMRDQSTRHAQQVRGLVREVTTLKALKPVLEERRDERFFEIAYSIEGNPFF
ncbi:MAG: hypothetical protein U5K99_06245 [Anaerolineales bacterium]|nr:hypothetical protein [Anaerolineales bacterium]